MKHMLSVAKCLPLCFLLFVSISASSQNLSDEDIKKNVTAIAQPLKSVISLEPRVFEYNTSEYSHLKLPKGEHYGFITEEFQQVFPALVTKKQQNYMQGKNLFKKATVKSVDMEGLIPILVASIKEQQQEIDQLRKEVEEMKKKIK